VKHLVEFPLEDGGSITIEIDEPETEGTVRAARGDTITKAKETLEDSLNKVVPVAKNVLEKLRDMAERPDEIEITFGVSLNTVAGAIIASASAGANFGVTVRWSSNKEEATSPHP